MLSLPTLIHSFTSLISANQNWKDKAVCLDETNCDENFIQLEKFMLLDKLSGIYKL